MGVIPGVLVSVMEEVDAISKDGAENMEGRYISTINIRDNHNF